MFPHAKTNSGRFVCYHAEPVRIRCKPASYRMMYGAEHPDEFGMTPGGWHFMPNDVGRIRN